MDFQTPEHMAKHLATYITCPSTVYAHTKNSWGRSPHIDMIRTWQKDHNRRTAPKNVGEPIAPIIRKAKPEKAERKPDAVPPTPRANPWPTWYNPFSSGLSIAQRLVESVARDFDVGPKELTGKSRREVLVHARAVVVRLLKERGWSYPRAARAVGRTDHSTAIHAIRHFDVYAKMNPQVQESYEKHAKMLLRPNNG